MKYLVYFIVLLAFRMVACNNMTLNVTNYHQLHKKYMAQMTRKFVDYHLYFPPVSSDKATCDKYEHLNVTQKIFNSLIQFCPNENHKLKVLSRSQVSWKNKKEEEEDARDLKSDNSTVREEAKNNQIHRHLLFVMMLPNHPFSQEMHHIISTVLPMFPQVNVVIGNAIEFRDMCSKYGLHSFPRIMYFKQGLYEDTYDEDITYTALAGRITHWTKLLPQAVPVVTPRHVHTTAQEGSIEWVNCGSLLDRVRAAVGWGVEWLGGLWRERFGGEFVLRNNNSTGDNNNTNSNVSHNDTDTFSSSSNHTDSSTVSQQNTPKGEQTAPQSSLPLWERDLFLPFPHSNIEPFIGSKLDAVPWDRGMFVLSGLYTFARLAMWYVEMRKGRGEEERE